MRNIIKNIILLLIRLIEKVEFKNNNFDENEPIKKINDIIFTKDVYVKTDYGIVPVSEINRTIPLKILRVTLENGLYLDCADNHIVFCKNHEEKFVKDLTTEDYLITIKGLSRVTNIERLSGKMSMYDLSINAPYPSYYTNGILSHNTVSASIVILWYCLFNNDKAVMIVANKGRTVAEIIRKIKSIYKYLPFFLKQGVISWNERSISFENGCTIHTENRTKEPSIGFTIDFLYLDEFAKVPSNIIEPYYGSVVPTVSSVENSKIIITSTPDGFNLFHDLLINAEREEGDPLKNEFAPMRVYWYQVKGRLDTKIFPLAYKTKEYNITREFIIDELKKLGYTLYEKEDNNRKWIYVVYDDNNENTKIDKIRSIRLNINNQIVPLSEICLITCWKEEQIKLLGGSEELFSQEYDLQFITGEKLLFDSDTIGRFKREAIEFSYIPFSKLDSALSLPYTQLKWVKNKPELFNASKMKDYYICASVDLSEGLCQDYTVLNIFRLLPKPKELIEKTYMNLNNVYEYFYLEQIGLFRANNWSISEFAELFYIVMFELFDPEKCKVVLEYNTYGATFLSELPKIFDGKHNYSNGIFLRYKHKKEDTQYKIGIKITGGENEASKKLLVKELQNAVNKNLIKLRNDININEISVFTKKETPSGNFTYQSEKGNDDTVMTLVTLSSIFSHVQYKNLIEHMMENSLTKEEKDIIEKYAFSKKTDEQVNYDSVKNTYKKIYKNNMNGFFRTTKSPWDKY